MTYNVFKRNNDVETMDDVLNYLFNNEPQANSNMLRTDIKETKDSFILDVEAPGVDKKDIKLSYDENYLTIEVNVNKEEENKEVSFIRKERMSGSYKRSFYVTNIDNNNIQASFENGILTINLKKKTKEEKNKYIEIA